MWLILYRNFSSEKNEGDEHHEGESRLRTPYIYVIKRIIIANGKKKLLLKKFNSHYDVCLMTVGH